MGTPDVKKETSVSMRFQDDDLAIIDRGADLRGLSRTEFMRRAALHAAQAAILNDSVIRVSPAAFDDVVRVIAATPTDPSPKVAERLQRAAPWDH